MNQYQASIQDPRIDLAIRAHERRIGRPIVAQYPFAYVIDIGTLTGANSTASNTVEFQTDADFLMESINGYVFDNALVSSANAVSRRNVAIQITDQASQQTLFQDFALLWNVAGDGISKPPFLNTDPYVFVAGSSAVVQLLNRTALTLVNNSVSLSGRKLVRG